MHTSSSVRRIVELSLALLHILLQSLLVPWRWLSWRLKYIRLGEMMPGPPSLPILGRSIGIEDYTLKGIFQRAINVLRKFTENSPIVRVYVGPYLVVFSNDPRENEKVLSSYKFVNKGQFYKFLSPWLASGLLTSEGSKWKTRRKMLIPAFHFPITEQFVSVFNSCSDELIRQMRKRAGNGGFDVCEGMKLLTMDVICETAMGVKINAQTNSNSPYVAAFNDILRLICERVIRPWLYFDFIYWFTRSGRKYRECLSILHGTTDKVIRERRRELEKVAQETSLLDVDELGRRRRVAFLDLLLLRARDGSLSDLDIREEVDTFMFAGQETTHTALSFTIFLLSIHQDVQNKILEELKGIFHSSQPSLPTSQQLSELKYLEMVINESVRLYPPVPTILGSINEDLTLPSTSNVLPDGSYMFVSPYGVHRNPELYPEPEKFDPTRFSPEECARRHPYAFLPFSAGPRNCIGQRFAMLEMKSVLAKFVWNYCILPEPGFEPDIVWEVGLKSLNGLQVRLEERRIIGRTDGDN